MGTDDKKSKQEHKLLSDEDAALWERVSGTAKPLVKGKNRDVPRVEAPIAEKPEKPKPKTPAKPAPKKVLERQPAPPALPPLGSFDRRELRGLAGGRLEIDGRIDLHGMRQREAHTALRAFVKNAQARGDRHVLVITGKGGRTSEDGIERGILNRQVPRWLNEPEFREAVVGFSPAHKRHGGEGALYVRLRRTR